MAAKERNLTLDLTKGLAALLVVLSHIIMKYNGYSQDMFFSLCFSVQIPLFMLAAGFASSYSKEITSMNSLCIHLKKRIRTLLLPWVVWTITYHFLLVH